MTLFFSCFVAMFLIFSAPAAARELRVTTWNLGWHLSQQEARQWIEACDALFTKDPVSAMWQPGFDGTKRGWDLKWGRNAFIEWDIATLPPCDVYRAWSKSVPVTVASYRKRAQQIASFLKTTVNADVLALQEVSGDAAVREVLPNEGKDYYVCSFSGHKVQRLAFAWRKELGKEVEPCEAYQPLSLPRLDRKSQVRPGLSMALRIDGKLVRFLNVHLKSSCVSYLDTKEPNGKVKPSGTDSACEILQQQIKPLEDWLAVKTRGADHLILLGDFNRNLWHESHEGVSRLVRSSSEHPRAAYPLANRSTNLLREVNDGDPKATKLVLLDEVCTVTSNAAALCDEGKSRLLTKEEQRQLSRPGELGCRNPVGLDHILITQSVIVMEQGRKVPLGPFGRTLAANQRHPDPLLAISDHCPLSAGLQL